MIIKIEDAPNIKHIKIDINFDDDDGPSVNIDKSVSFANPTPASDQLRKSIMDDVALDTDTDYSISDEVVEKPEIPDTDREVKVSDDMENATF
jgi:hypothetical protein